MDHFTYRDGHLHCEDLPAGAIADAAGTPCYVYSRATLLEHFRRLEEAFADLDPLICFAVKSCSNLSVCRLLLNAGAGLDLVSGGELHRAMRAGADPARCVYAGVGKTDAEIAAALEAGIGWFNVESREELQRIRALATASGRSARVALRVNPDVDARTHRHTTTGTRQTKFGVAIDVCRQLFDECGSDRHCRLAGLHVHLGSPIYSAEPYVTALERVLELLDELTGAGHAVELLNLGGGFGADYETGQSPPPREYAEAIVPMLARRVAGGLRIALEPGRMITANAGILLLTVLYTKSCGQRTFVICDGGMNVLIRPAHYDAFHFIWPCRVETRHVPPRRARELDLPGLVEVDVVGPICETGDFLATQRGLPPVKRGDRLAVFSTGAYGMVMASRYNGMPLPAEVLVEGSGARLIRRRETRDDLIAHELDPTPLAHITHEAPPPAGDPSRGARV
jgi:diaminopimelate decarboxylase